MSEMAPSLQFQLNHESIHSQTLRELYFLRDWYYLLINYIIVLIVHI